MPNLKPEDGHLDLLALDLFSVNIKNFRLNTGGQAMGLCPFHDDKTPSFSVNIHTGLWSCKACGLSGNAITFSEKLNIGPSMPKPERELEILSADQLETIDRFAVYLQDNLKSLQTSGRVPAFWSEDILKQTRTGFDPDRGCLTFAHSNIDGTSANIKWHKPVNGESSQLSGHGENRLFPLHLLREYSTGEPLIYCEGEKDCISLLSMGLQGVTHTCGALSVPDDLTPLKDFKKIYIVFDHDPTGFNGSEDTAKALKRSFPEMQIFIYEWHIKTRPNFDVTDYFSSNGTVVGFNRMMRYARLYQYNHVSGEGKLWLYRKITDSRVFKDADLLQIWIFCLTEASHKRTVVNAKYGTGYKQITLDRGQFLYSLDKAVQKTRQPKSTLRGRFKRLENMGKITVSKVECRTIVTICKWRLYQ